MIYSGSDATGPVTTGTDTQIGTSAFNGSNNNNAYVGYMYGNINASDYTGTHANMNDSNIKRTIDEWYKTSTLINYADKLDKNTGFCNDRTLYIGTGIGTTTTNYKAFYRLNANKSPKLTCVVNDLYTMTESVNGNKALIYPIGLITADEISFAGGVNNKINTSYYLYIGQIYWTMSPYYHRDYYGADMFSVWVDGYLNSSSVSEEHGIRPVINLKSDVQITGSGTTTDPYEIN